MFKFHQILPNHINETYTKCEIYYCNINYDRICILLSTYKINMAFEQ